MCVHDATTNTLLHFVKQSSASPPPSCRSCTTACNRPSLLVLVAYTLPFFFAFPVLLKLFFFTKVVEFLSERFLPAGIPCFFLQSRRAESFKPCVLTLLLSASLVIAVSVAWEKGEQGQYPALILRSFRKRRKLAE